MGALCSSTVLIAERACTGACTTGFCIPSGWHEVLIADLRIPIKDYRRGNNLKVLLLRTPFGPRQYFVRMNGAPWPAGGNRCP
jgi:hypothetical protein